MSSFLKENTYSMVRLFLTQIVMSVFGLILSFATTGNPTLHLVAGIFSALFYFVMIFHFVSSIGAADRVRVNGGRMTYQPAGGLILSLGANLPNLLLTSLMGVGILIDKTTTGTFGGNMTAIANMLLRLICGMFTAVITEVSNLIWKPALLILEDGSTTKLTNAKIEDIWWWFFVAIALSILVGFIAYRLGHKNITFDTLFPKKRED